MRKLCIVSICCLLVLAGQAAASHAPITQIKTFKGAPNLDKTLTFNEFDDQSGTLTLTSIWVKMYMTVNKGHLVLDNDGEQAASGTWEFGAEGDITSPDVALINGAFQPVIGQLSVFNTDTFSLAANEGDGENDYDPTAPDGMEYSGVFASDNDAGFISDTVFNQYIGTGTYDILADINQYQDFGGVSGIEWAVTPVFSTGYVLVRYTYTPEPATMSLLALGGLALLRRKRRN